MLKGEKIDERRSFTVKVLLISPGKDEYYKKRLKLALKMPPLTLSTIAALTKPDIEVAILDEHVEPINYDDVPDLVGITVMTSVAPRAYKIADKFRKSGAKVVLGGPHPSALPKEAIRHCDAVVIGEAEGAWEKLLEDFKNGDLKQFYSNEKLPSLVNLPEPRRDLYKKEAYYFVNSLQVSRGCPFNCSFCSVSNFFGRTYRHRPIADVIREIEHLEGKFVAFIDDNIVGNPKYSKELFNALIPLKIRWVGQSSFNIIRDPDLLKAAKKSGCAGLFIGLETISEESMQEIGKVQNDIKEFKVGIKRLHDHGIIVLGAFIFGFDSDDKDVFKRTLDFALESKLDLAQFSILTPLPGTRLYEKLSSEDRIINADWSKYDMGNAVFMPAQMTPEELQKGMGWAWREFYSYGSILKRLFSVNFHLLRHLLYFAPLLVLNMSFKRALDFESKMAKASITKH